MERGKTVFIHRWHASLYNENMTECTIKQPELVSESRKVAGYKINIQNQLYFYLPAKSNWKSKFLNVLFSIKSIRDKSDKICAKPEHRKLQNIVKINWRPK